MQGQYNISFYKSVNFNFQIISLFFSLYIVTIIVVFALVVLISLFVHNYYIKMPYFSQISAPFLLLNIKCSFTLQQEKKNSYYHYFYKLFFFYFSIIFLQYIIILVYIIFSIIYKYQNGLVQQYFSPLHFLSILLFVQD